MPYSPMPYSPMPYAPLQQGWVCPKCGAVMAPFVPTCWHCQPRHVITTTVTFATTTVTFTEEEE